MGGVGRWVVVCVLDDLGFQEREECRRALSHTLTGSTLYGRDAGVISAAKVAAQSSVQSKQNSCSRRQVRYTAKQQTWSSDGRLIPTAR